MAKPSEQLKSVDGPIIAIPGIGIGLKSSRVQLECPSILTSITLIDKGRRFRYGII